MRKLFFFLILTFFSFTLFSQVRLGIFGGIANYQGDLTDKVFMSPRSALGITAGYDVSGRINLRAGLTFAKVAGADSLLKKTELRLRNLSFQSPVTEFSLIGEFNTFDLDTKSWSPYVFVGLAVYHFNPYTFDQFGNKVYLQPLRTEGQGLPGYPDSKPYALTQLAIPFGAGIKYNISDNVRIGLELGLRKLFTDYLDDVSGNYAAESDLAAVSQQSVALSYRGDEVPGGSPFYPAKGITRGSPKYKDYYYFTGIHLSFLLPGSNESRLFSGKRRKGYGCPANPL
jgi:opacity protein-like surface antigen